MKRQIKFRVWDGENMLPVSSVSFSYRDSHPSIWFATPKGTHPNIHEVVIDGTLMQYTGLKCYDGLKWAEVYEGDILFKHGKHSVVEWDGVFLTRRLKTPKGDRNYLVQHHDMKEEDSTRLDGFKLCGNIFQNADLIK